MVSAKTNISDEYQLRIVINRSDPTCSYNTIVILNWNTKINNHTILATISGETLTPDVIDPQKMAESECPTSFSLLLVALLPQIAQRQSEARHIPSYAEFVPITTIHRYCCDANSQPIWFAHTTGCTRCMDVAGELRKVADSSNNDVDRALAACGASQMQYRNFEELNLEDPTPNPATVSNHEFPLLIEALPEVGQIPVAVVISEPVAAPVSEAPSPAPDVPKPTNLFTTPNRLPARSPEPGVSIEKAKPNAHPDGPSRKTLSSVFRTLSAAAPANRKSPATATGLQGIFNRL